MQLFFTYVKNIYFSLTQISTQLRKYPTVLLFKKEYEGTHWQCCESLPLIYNVILCLSSSTVGALIQIIDSSLPQGFDY